MGQARLIRHLATAGAVALLCGALPSGGVRAAGASRFASYDTEANCVASHTFAPAACRTAFANARSEYEAKTPSFASEALCTRRYATCMAWPPGAAGRPAGYRPSWDGVDIVDTPTEHSVTPSPGSTGRTVRFAARSLDAEPARLTIRGASIPAPPLRQPAAAPVIAGHPGRPSAAPAFAGGADKPLPPSPAPPPGSGFRLEDGVLTYPAPARFQPRNLPKQP
ncbi:DUF1190 domain-containing protein [Lichenibacterium dinghuense]|uniref:DUF1190 domain-containing protein n=1 Tax=Lichenibacterium dinghuense TaxID=2895977 RepID=UPI001F1E0997|nr:DUF1190 domain-containing protein [Lichenibacterium sp. 6Y81]